MKERPKYWVACSGGVDSVVLSRLMHAQKKEFGILHCNFHLRKEASNKDEAFVRNLAAKLNVPIRVKEFNTIAYGQDNRLNIQLAARELRYAWFDEIIKNENVIVLLAHHYDDQMETFFLQLRRGAKIKGLAGMPEYRNGYLRPLLKHSKKDLIALARQNNWSWQEDVTNASNDYSRNWYRNEVIPFFRQSNFPLDEILPLMANLQKLLCHFQKLDISSEISIKKWNNLPYLWKQFVLSEYGLSEYSVEEIDKLSDSVKGKYIGNSKCKIWNEGDYLAFVYPVNENQFYLKSEQVTLAEVKPNKTSLFIDEDGLNMPLSIRKWKAGDTFQPKGMKGRKTLGKFLRDKKVAAHKKKNVFVLLDQLNDVIGVFGFGVSDKYSISESSRSVLKCELQSRD